MIDNTIPNVADGSIRDRMKIVPLGERQWIAPSRFRTVRNLGRLLSMKAHRLEGENVAAATAVIADPAASDDALRSAFLRVSVALEAEIATTMMLRSEIATLRGEVAAIKRAGT